MSGLRTALVFGAALAFVGCSPNLCDRAKSAAEKTQGDCPDAVAGPLPGAGSVCTMKLTDCSDADQELISTAVECTSKLSVCSAIAADAWKLQQKPCVDPLTGLTPACSKAIFGDMPPGYDAGIPDAGPQPIVDGGNGVQLLGLAVTTDDDAGTSTIALAWENLRTANVEQWILVTTDGVGDNRTETSLTPGTLINLSFDGGGLETRQYFLAGATAAGEVLTGSVPTTMEEVDAGPGCHGANDCPTDRVCDLGQCRQQTCVFGQLNTCPAGYGCVSSNQCARTGDDGGSHMGPSGDRDAGIDPRPMISNLLQLTPRPPMAPDALAVGTGGASAGDIAAFDTARVTLALEQDSQIISHPSFQRGADLGSEVGTSYGLDTTGVHVHLAWNLESNRLFACYVVGRSARAQVSDDRGKTWGKTVLTIDPPGIDDGGVESIRDCDIAPWTGGGAIMVTSIGDNLEVRELTPALTVAATSTAFAGTGGVTYPQRPAIAAFAPTDGRTPAVYVTFTGTRQLALGADAEPYVVSRSGTAAWQAALRLTPTVGGGNALPDDYTAVAVNQKTGGVLAAFTTVDPIVHNSTVYVSPYRPTAANPWATASFFNVLVNDDATNTSYVLPAHAATDTWFVFSPAIAPLPDGSFAVSFVAGPQDSMGVGTYGQYFVRFDPNGTNPKAAGSQGWFVPPATRVSSVRVLDPRASSSTPQPPVSSLTADSQLSIYGVFIEGSGVMGATEGQAYYWHWP